MATKYFEELFASSTLMELEEVLREIPTMISVQLNDVLRLLLRKKKFIKHCSLCIQKSIRLRCAFFRRAWQVIK